MGGETAKYQLSFVVNNKELTTKEVETGAAIAPPTTDGNGNAVSWYSYPAMMPAHDLVVYGMVVRQPEPWHRLRRNVVVLQFVRLSTHG